MGQEQSGDWPKPGPVWEASLQHTTHAVILQVEVPRPVMGTCALFVNSQTTGHHCVRPACQTACLVLDGMKISPELLNESTGQNGQGGGVPAQAIT